MQTPFAEWLNAKLAERQWKASDLTRASRTPDFRGLDSGLISRWLAPYPQGATPTHVQTLQRLAHALSVAEAEVYQAVGLLPSSVPAPKVQTELETRLAHLGATLSHYPRSVWLAVLEANECMVNALAYQGESHVPPSALNAPARPSTRGNPRRKGQLPSS